MKWLVHYAFGLFRKFDLLFNSINPFNPFNREHLQEVISLLSNEPKTSSLPLNENKDEIEEETIFTDTVK
jgi:hypothetical protein